MKKPASPTNMSRRHFLGVAGTAASVFTILPSYAVSGLGHVAPSDKLNIAGIGVGGKGWENLANMPGQNMVALCDVDWEYARPVFKKYPRAKQYQDFRVMLEQQKDIDAVVIATPDHTHAVAAMWAMQLGKHVYVQKPLTHSVWEARQLTEAARNYKVATQMGNEGHSQEEVRQVAELIWSGVIGDVTEVYATTNRPIWPQGLERPTDKQAVPKTLDWDLFLGPAPKRPYHEAYHPWSWRAWWDFGTGALGDMGCHVMDVPFFALKLKYPTAVQASSTVVNTESAPQASRVEYTFPGRGDMPALKLIWSDGGIMPGRPVELPAGVKMGDWGGMNLFIGTKGKIISGYYGNGFKVLPFDLDYKLPEKTIPRIVPDRLGGGLHEMDWVRACKESPENRMEACSNFEYAGPLTETVVMGNLAIRLQGLERELAWDGGNMVFTNISPSEEVELITSHQYKKIKMLPQFKTETTKVNALEFAREMVKHTYRKGWGW
ncbi:Gfo/Idh/MocA family protein [Gaoshiqia sediminis]|uniref:Gfo/Idh/MocA family oxidoreductase n=1 Tax=Gaoshiqia sediminis TaxID=2986998 RepID=A0AA42C8Q8_9BACT|nr:Gfo/Idh/MocA family oxidoreductase [Gaoshiqia sediminis]MCW0481160.1 Gfo/Idh/MocA family oxidoreductase [Gaoshiqia sediminis]